MYMRVCIHSLKKRQLNGFLANYKAGEGSVNMVTSF